MLKHYIRKQQKWQQQMEDLQEYISKNGLLQIQLEGMQDYGRRINACYKQAQMQTKSYLTENYNDLFQRFQKNQICKK